MISIEQLRLCMPSLPLPKARGYYPFLISAMTEYEIDTNSLRIAAFLAQLGHESLDLQYMEEIASGAAYDNRKDLGNTKPEAVQIAKSHGTTPGRFWKGHGPIQTTGYDNHKKAGDALGIDAVNYPELLSFPTYGFCAAGLYWREKKLNPIADLGLSPFKLTRRIKGVVRVETVPAFDAISFKVNGGWNGREDRMKRYKDNLVVLD